MTTLPSSAGRTALEAAVSAPASLFADRDVKWRPESDDVVVANWTVPPERPEVRLRIDEDGAVFHWPTPADRAPSHGR